MKTIVRLLALTTVAGTAAFLDTAVATPLFPLFDRGGIAEGCVVAHTCRPLNVDVPVYLWLIADNQTQGTDGPRAAQREIKDASLGLDEKTMA